MTQTTPTYTLRSKWLEKLLPAVAFDGWTDTAAKAAAEEAGLTDGEQALAAPNGVNDLIEAFFDRAEAEAELDLTEQDMSAVRTPDRVAAGVKAWLKVLEPNREAVRQATKRGFLPIGPGSASGAVQRAWSVADMVWDAAGDTATDYNRYTKRGLLAAIIPPTVMYWLDAPDGDELDAYIMKRLKQVSGIGQKAGKVGKPMLNLASGLYAAAKGTSKANPWR